MHLPTAPVPNRLTYAGMGIARNAKWGEAYIAALLRAPNVRFTRLSLYTRVLLTNAAVLVAAAVVLAVSPATVSSPVALYEAAIIVGGVVALVVANLVLLRRAFAPLRRLRGFLARVEYLNTGDRVPVYGDDVEVVEVTQAVNDMLDRLERERTRSWRRAARAQENERLRVAQELHDEVGQSLTALKLLLSRAMKAPDQRDELLAEAHELTSSTTDDVRQIARRLRPETLDELGLANALGALADRTAAYSGLEIARHGDPPPPLHPDTELVVYRVCQEALTNVVRHAEASRADLWLSHNGGAIEVCVMDDGKGIDGDRPENGIQGMRERALMVGGDLDILRRAVGGTEVRLRVPVAGPEEENPEE